jgi:hypothetical protein
VPTQISERNLSGASRLHTGMSPQASRFPALAAVLAAVVLAAPAQGAEVIVVDGERAERRQDPLVPSRSAVRLAPPPGARPARAASPARLSARGSRAVSRALARALRSGAIDRSSYDRYRRAYRRARSSRRRVRGARAIQLGYVIASLDRIALRGLLVGSRMPSLFIQLERNTRYWPSLPYPRSGDQVSFRGSELLYQYYPGRGLQLQPLSTFKKANLMHGACVGVVDAPCRRDGLKLLLDEMIGLGTRRGPGFIAWEYLFDFGGGSPPWISGMAQATGIQALGRASQLLAIPAYADAAREALGAFETASPTGVRARGFRGGTHYLQYSFAPRLYIYNAFLQSLIGLYDFANITGDARAMGLYARAEPEARREMPSSDVGDWSRYSYRGHESNHDYHELLRELLQSMCNRRLGPLYCDYASRYRGYQVDPPELTFTGPEAATRGRYTRLRFDVSKLSAVEVSVYKGSRLAMRRLATFRRGPGSFLWRPRSAGFYTIRLGAKELRTGLGKKDRAAGEVEVLSP